MEAKRITITVPRLALAPGQYGFTLFSSVNGEIADWIKSAGSFNVEGGDYYGTGQAPVHGQGQMLMEHEIILSAGT